MLLLSRPRELASIDHQSVESLDTAPAPLGEVGHMLMQTDAARYWREVYNCLSARNDINIVGLVASQLSFARRPAAWT